MNKRILVVEDEPNLAFNLKYNLNAEGYDVAIASNGKIALEEYSKGGSFDLIVMDVMLPEINGFDVAKAIRNKDDITPIIMLTARSANEDRIHGLELGIDDYITKPFHLQEFLLRVKRILRRSILLEKAYEESSMDVSVPVGEESIIAKGPFALDTKELKLKIDGYESELTVLETKILAEFLKNPNKVLSREYLLEKAWGIKSSQETRTVDNFIVRLRKIIEADFANPEYLQSVRGRGYRFKL